MTFTPPSKIFDDILDLIGRLPAAHEDMAERTRIRNAQLTKPEGSLGCLEDLAIWLSAWQGRHPPRCDQPMVSVFASNHGVATHGVSAFPQDVTAQMVANFQAGGAAINQLCDNIGATLKVFEMALDHPTNDIMTQDAMDARGCAATIAYGMEAIAGGCDILAIGEMGIGNTTIAAAICGALFHDSDQDSVRDWVGRGTGIDEPGLQRKRETVAAAIRRMREEHGPDPHPLTVLCSLGGRDIAGMIGAILAARSQHVPVVIDGFVVSAAAAVLYAISPHTLDHCIFGHVSAEQAHRALLNRMDKRPILDLGMRLGEGTGAVLAIGIVKAAVATHNGMRTFTDAGVSEKNIS